MVQNKYVLPPRPLTQVAWPPINQTRLADFVSPPPTRRVPVITRRLMEVAHSATDWQHNCRFADRDVALKLLGNYNPLYNGVPKKVPMALLVGCMPMAKDATTSLLRNAGLMYTLPYIAGVRKSRVRTNHVGLLLLKAWAVNFPKFKPYLDAFLTEQRERVIVSECFDLSMGHRPPSMQAMDKLNEEVYIPKVREREDREKRKQEKLRRLEQKRAEDAAALVARAKAQWQANMQKNTAMADLNLATQSLQDVSWYQKVIGRWIK